MLLTTGKLLGFAPGIGFHLDQLQHGGHPVANFAFRQLVLFQAHGNVLLHRHMGEQGIGLEHHVGRAQERGQSCNVLAVEHDGAGVGRFKTCEHA